MEYLLISLLGIISIYTILIIISIYNNFGNYLPIYRKLKHIKKTKKSLYIHDRYTTYIRYINESGSVDNFIKFHGDDFCLSIMDRLYVLNLTFYNLDPLYIYFYITIKNIYTKTMIEYQFVDKNNFLVINNPKKQYEPNIKFKIG